MHTTSLRLKKERLLGGRKRIALLLEEVREKKNRSLRIIFDGAKASKGKNFFRKEEKKRDPLLPPQGGRHRGKLEAFQLSFSPKRERRVHLGEGARKRRKTPHHSK